MSHYSDDWPEPAFLHSTNYDFSTWSSTHINLGKTEMYDNSPKTQKSRGLSILSSDYWPNKGAYELYSCGSRAMGGESIHHDTGKLKWALLPYDTPFFPAFARPCPVKPRHGFIDSVSVYQQEALLRLYAKAIIADNGAEIILMDELSGRRSAVATSVGVSWGDSHDGATLGKDVTFILAPSDEYTWSHALLGSGFSRASIGITDSLYIEIVEHCGSSIAVQARNGPRQVATVDFIPEVTKVVRVVYPTMKERVNMMEWEARINKLVSMKTFKGTVVNLPAGYGLSSHVAVHAIANNIPVITSFMPEKGQTIKPADGAKTKKLGEADFITIADYLGEWVNTNYEDTRLFAPMHFDIKHYDVREKNILQGILYASLGTLHTQGLWGNGQSLLLFRAFAVSSIAKLLAVACIGEARHFFRHGPGQKNIREVQVKWAKFSPVVDKAVRKGDGSMQRSDTFKYALRMQFVDLRECLYDAMLDLSPEGWNSSDGGYGYGGPKWADAANVTLFLMEMISEFCKTPTEKNWKNVIMATNDVVSVVHNGGRVLNKWINQDKMDKITASPGLGFLSDAAGQLANSDTPPIAKARKFAILPQDRRQWKAIDFQEVINATKKAAKLKADDAFNHIGKLALEGNSIDFNCGYPTSTLPSFDTLDENSHIACAHCGLKMLDNGAVSEGHTCYINLEKYSELENSQNKCQVRIGLISKYFGDGKVKEGQTASELLEELEIIPPSDVHILTKTIVTAHLKEEVK